MSSRDIREILSLPTQPLPSSSSSLLSAPAARIRAPRQQVKRPAGISRELFSLLGDNSSTLALSTASLGLLQPKFKEKTKGKAQSKPRGKQVKWRKTGFKIASREEGSSAQLVLRHWVKDLPDGHLDGTVDDKFNKFNTFSTPLLFDYTDEEYTTILINPQWTREETDELFHLARLYDLRFIVMADRWESTNPKSVDQLKDRYYAVGRALLRSRKGPENLDESAKSALLKSFDFDITRETERKTYLKSLLSRTASQVAEEDFLYIESRRLEQTYHRTTSEREAILRILGGREGIGATGGVQVGVGGGEKGRIGNLGASGEKRKRGSVGWAEEGLNGAGLPDGWAGEGSKRKSTPAQDLVNCIERHPLPSMSATKALPYPSISLRSARLPAPKASVAQRVATALTELSISTKLILPTKENVDKLDALQTALGGLVEMKKMVDRAEGELRMMRKRKELLNGIVAEEEEAKKAVVAAATAQDDSARQNKRSASVTSNADPDKKRARKD